MDDPDGAHGNPSHYCLVGVGSVGDVVPMVRLGSELRQRGHRVSIVSFEHYRGLVEEAGLHTVPIPGQPLGAMWSEASQQRRAQLAQPGLMYASMVRRLARIAPAVNDAILDVATDATTFVSGLVSLGACRLAARRTSASAVGALFAPLLPSRSAETSSLAARHLGAVGALVTSRLMWRLTTRLSAATTADMAGRFSMSDGGDHSSLTTAPLLLATSPHVCPPSPDWPTWVRQTGAWLPRQASGELSAQLRGFLDRPGSRVLMTFGSCPAVDPLRDLALFLGAADDLNARLVVQTDLRPAGRISDSVFNAVGVDHAALMPAVDAVVHHGGAGTTMAAIRAGRPAVVVPHLGDQAYYGRRVHRLGLGPAPVPRWRLTQRVLTTRLDQVLSGAKSAATRRRALDMQRLIAGEDGVGLAADLLVAHAQREV